MAGLHRNGIIFADNNNPPRYCCVDKKIRVDECEEAELFLQNYPGPVDILHFPTGNTSDPSVVYRTIENGVHYIRNTGIYLLDINCDDWERELVPDVDEVLVQCKVRKFKPDEYTNILLTQICDKLQIEEGVNTVSILMSILNTLTNTNTLLQSVCEKLEEGNTNTQAICDKIEITNTKLDEWLNMDFCCRLPWCGPNGEELCHEGTPISHLVI